MCKKFKNPIQSSSNSSEGRAGRLHPHEKFHSFNKAHEDFSSHPFFRSWAETIERWEESDAAKSFWIFQHGSDRSQNTQGGTSKNARLEMRFFHFPLFILFNKLHHFHHFDVQIQFPFQKSTIREYEGLAPPFNIEKNCTSARRSPTKEKKFPSMFLLSELFCF